MFDLLYSATVGAIEHYLKFIQEVLWNLLIIVGLIYLIHFKI
jgi:hypothetical protein